MRSNSVMTDSWKTIRSGVLTGHEINQLSSNPSPHATRFFNVVLLVGVGVGVEVGVGVVGRDDVELVGRVVDAVV